MHIVLKLGIFPIRSFLLPPFRVLGGGVGPMQVVLKLRIFLIRSFMLPPFRFLGDGGGVGVDQCTWCCS